MDNKLNQIGERIERREINAVDFKEYEEWLENIEAEGWNLKSIDMNYDHTFVKGEPRNIRYCLDYREDNKKEYVKMFKDFGWNLIYINYTDFLWAKEYEGVRPEIFNEIEALVETNKSFKKRIKRDLQVIILFIIAYYVIDFTFGYLPPLIIIAIAFIIMIISPKNLDVLSFQDYKYIKIYYKNKKLIEKGLN